MAAVRPAPSSQEALEVLVSEIVDRHTLRRVLQALTNVCYANSARLNRLMRSAAPQDMQEMQCQADGWGHTGRELAEVGRHTASYVL